MTTFRVDDVSANTEHDSLSAIIAVIRECVPDAEIMLAVSPLVMSLLGEPVRDQERAFPRILSAMSDHRLFYGVQIANQRPYMPVDTTGIVFVSHGLVHVDHRLLGREAQELSIVASCSLVGTRIFCPPFNKHNHDTASVCAEHGVELIRFEDGWRHVRFNAFDPKNCQKYYCHTHDMDAAWLKEWFAK